MRATGSLDNNVQWDMEEHERIGFGQPSGVWRNLTLTLALPDTANIFRNVWSEGTFYRVDGGCKQLCQAAIYRHGQRGRTRLLQEPIDLILEQCEQVRRIAIHVSHTWWIQSYSVGMKNPNQFMKPLEYAPESRKYIVKRCVMELVPTRSVQHS